MNKHLNGVPAGFALGKGCLVRQLAKEEKYQYFVPHEWRWNKKKSSVILASGTIPVSQECKLYAIQRLKPVQDVFEFQSSPDKFVSEEDYQMAKEEYQVWKSENKSIPSINSQESISTSSAESDDSSTSSNDLPDETFGEMVPTNFNALENGVETTHNEKKRSGKFSGNYHATCRPFKKPATIMASEFIPSRRHLDPGLSPIQAEALERPTQADIEKAIDGTEEFGSRLEFTENSRESHSECNAEVNCESLDSADSIPAIRPKLFAAKLVERAHHADTEGKSAYCQKASDCTTEYHSGHGQDRKISTQNALHDIEADPQIAHPQLIYQGLFSSVPFELREACLSKIVANVVARGGKETDLQDWLVSIELGEEGRHMVSFFDRETLKRMQIVVEIICALGLATKTDAQAFSFYLIRDLVHTTGALPSFEYCAASDIKHNQLKVLDGDDNFSSNSIESGLSQNDLAEVNFNMELTLREPITRICPLTGISQLVVSRIGSISAKNHDCYLAYNVITPVGFRATRTWLGQTDPLEPHLSMNLGDVTYCISVEDGPLFVLEVLESGGECTELCRASMPCELWRKILRKIDVPLSSLEAGMSYAELMKADSRKTRKPKKPSFSGLNAASRGSCNFALKALSSFNSTIPEQVLRDKIRSQSSTFDDQLELIEVSIIGKLELMRHLFSDSESKTGDGYTTESLGVSADQKKPELLGCVRVDGIQNISSNWASADQTRPRWDNLQVGDSIFAVKIENAQEWTLVHNAKEILAILDNANSARFAIQRFEFPGRNYFRAWNFLYNTLLCHESAYRNATVERLEDAFLLGSLLCGTIDSSGRLALLLEAMPSSLKYVDYIYRVHQSAPEMKARQMKLRTWEELISMCSIFTSPLFPNAEKRKGQSIYTKSIFHRYKELNVSCMNLEDIRSQKLRASLRKEDLKNTWKALESTLLPSFFFESGAEEHADFSHLLQFFLPEKSRKSNIDSNLFSLEPLYFAVENRCKRNMILPERQYVESTAGQIELVVNAIVAKVELERCWSSKHRASLARQLQRWGTNLSAVLFEEGSVDAKRLREAGFNETSLQFEVIRRRLYEGMNRKAQKGRIMGSTELSVRDQVTIRGVVRDMVNFIVKDHVNWRKEQRNIEVARRKIARDRFAAQRKLTEELEPDEYATLCTAVEIHGMKWGSILDDDYFKKLFRDVHRSPNILAKAWSDLDTVVSVRGHVGEYYPLMGFFVKLSVEASNRRSAKFNDTEDIFTCAYSEEGECFHPLDRHLTYIGIGSKDLISSRFQGRVFIQSDPCGKRWAIFSFPSNNEAVQRNLDLHYGYMYFLFKDDEVTTEDILKVPGALNMSVQECRIFSHEEDAWVKDSKCKLTIMKLPTYQRARVVRLTKQSSLKPNVAAHFDLEEIPKYAKQDELVHRIQCIVEKRSKLLDAQYALEAMLDDEHREELIQSNLLLDRENDS